MHPLPRALSRTAATSARPGTLSRCTGAQTWRPDRLQAARGLAGTWIVAAKLRSAARRTDTPARQAERHAPDDSAVKPDQTAWPPTGTNGGGRSNRSGLCGCRGDAAPGGSCGPDTCAQCAHRVGRTCPFRTTTAGDHRLRWVAESGGGTMNAQATVLETASVQQQCKVLRLPAIAAQCGQLAEQAVRERRSHLGFLEALLQAELEEREDRLVERRIREAHLPRMKTLEEFDFARNPKISAQQIHELAQGVYIGRAEPVIFIGDSGTGKTHLLTGLAVAACRQKRRVRFTTAAALINEMVEAKHQLQLGRALSRWARYDLIALDEVGYVPLAEVGAELLFQVIAERAEKAAVIVTTNLPFSEWTTVIPNARLCKALIDRITDRANIIKTGTESYRFRRTLEKRKAKGVETKS